MTSQFYSQDDLDNLDDDPRMAFLTLVDHAERSLAEQTKGLDLPDKSQWEQREELRHSFMNVVIAAASNSKSSRSFRCRFRVYPIRKEVIFRKLRLTLTTTSRNWSWIEVYGQNESVSILSLHRGIVFRNYVNGLRQCSRRQYDGAKARGFAESSWISSKQSLKDGV